MLPRTNVHKAILNENSLISWQTERQITMTNPRARHEFE
jgi:hypothetical protein